MSWRGEPRKEATLSNLEHTPDALAEDVILSRATNTDPEPAIIQPGAKLLRLSDVEPEEIQWVWYGVLAVGKLTMLSSDPGCGKSTLSIDIASRLSRGLPWPITGNRPDIGSTILLSAEDDPADTIRPRLDAAGGDPVKVHVLQAMCDYDPNGKVIERSLNLEKDMDALAEMIQEVGDCRLVVVDPISAYMGGVDSHKNAEVRSRILAPLAAMARRHGLAVLCITHLSKSNGKAIYRSIGSIAFTAAARLAFGIVKCSQDPHRRLLVPTKANIVPDASGFGYQVIPAPSNPAMGVIQWEPDPVTEGAEVLFAREADPETRSDDQDILRETIIDAIADEPKSFADIQSEVTDVCGKVGEKRLRSLLKDVAKKEKAGFDGGWVWRSIT